MTLGAGNYATLVSSRVEQLEKYVKTLHIKIADFESLLDKHGMV